MWKSFTDRNGIKWQLDDVGLWVLIRQHVSSMAILRRSRVKQESHWFGPDLVTVETDFLGLAQERDHASFILHFQAEKEIRRDGSFGLQLLTGLRREAEAAVARVRQMQRQASRELSANIDASIHRYEIGMEAAKITRDICFTTVVVGASFLTGGAAVAVLGGGSALKGVASYQDTGHVGSAVLTATGTFVVGAIPIVGGEGGALEATDSIMTKVPVDAAKVGRKAALVVVGASVDAGFEYAGALIEGKDAKTALRGAAVRFGFDLFGGAIGIKLDKIALPAIVRIVNDTVTSYISDRAVDHSTAENTAAARSSPSSLPQPSDGFCDAHSVLSTGRCTHDDWVQQLVLRRAL